MITLIYGASASGKSEFAEDYVCKLGYKDRYYLATMQSDGLHAKERIKRHRELRAGKGFVTLEHPRDVINAIAEIQEIDLGDFSTNETKSSTVVLLECLSNLVANEMFKDGEIVPKELCVDKILADINELAANVSYMVVVTNDIFDDGNSYDLATKEYMRALGEINRRLAKQADQVYEVVVGIGIRL